jgi:hypothetical protein
MLGVAHSLVSTPLYSLQLRFTSPSVPTESLWHFAYTTIRDLGLRAIYSPLRSSLIKESLSYGLFFGVFEYIKQQGYYNFLNFYYGGHRPILSSDDIRQNEKRPHWSISPFFVILAGCSASIGFSTISFPFNRIQQATVKSTPTFREFVSSPSKEKIVPSVLTVIRRGGLYRGFSWHALRMIPGPSVALIIFEAVRRKSAPEGEGVWGGDVVVPITRERNHR